MNAIRIDADEFLRGGRTPEEPHELWFKWTVIVVLFVSVIGMFLPCFIGPSRRRVAPEKADMHMVQLAAESYATDMAGVYPERFDQLAPYFPGGGNVPNGAAGLLPPWCVCLNLKINSVQNVRYETEDISGIEWQISRLSEDQIWVGFCPIKDKVGRTTSYAVVGGVGPHLSKGNANMNLVLSNQ